MAALKLLEAPSGPVIEDFPEDAPPSKESITTLSCPVDFAQADADLTKTEQLCGALKREIASLRPWHELALKSRGRTTVGVSGMDVDVIPDFICSFLGDGLPENPRKDVSLPYTLNFVTDDLKAYYYEAMTAQPGQESPSSEVLSNWFWDETVAGKVLRAVKAVCKKSEDGMMRIVGALLIVPAAQVFRDKEKKR